MEGSQGTKRKLSRQQKLWWRQQQEDRSGPNSWAWPAALFVPVTGAQEEQPRSREEEKLWSEATLVPSACVPQRAGCETCQCRGQGPAAAWRSSVICGPHSSLRGTGCSISSLQHLQPAPVCAMAEKQLFWSSLFCAPLSTPVTAVSRDPLALRSCGWLDSPKFPLAPAFKQERQRNPFPFWDILCHENTTVRKSKCFLLLSEKWQTPTYILYNVAIWVALCLK